MIRTIGVLCVAGAAVCIAPQGFAQSLYIAEVNLLDEGYVRRMNVDGSGFETLYATSGGLRGLELVPSRNEAYLSDVDLDIIYRVCLDTFDQPETLASGLTFPIDLAANANRDMLAWMDSGPDKITLSRLDGSNPHTLVSGIVSSVIAMDPLGDWVYFESRASAERGAICRVRLDGTDLETIIADVPTATDIAVDPIHSYVYWGSSAGFDNTGGIYRVRFNGTGFEEIFKSDTPRRDATTLAVDPTGGHVYFAVDISTTEEAIFRMGLDGENTTLICAGFGAITDMSILIPAPGVLAPLALAALLASHRRRA